MIKSYKGLCEALNTAENIINQNLGLEWDEFIDIFHNDPIIQPYYFDVCGILLAGRNTLRWEEILWGGKMNKFDLFLIIYGIFVILVMTYIAYKGK